MGTEEVIKKGSQSSKEEQFPSSSTLLEMVRDEYSDNKASFFISLIVLVSTIFIPIVPFGRIKAYYSDVSVSCLGKTIVASLLTLNGMAFVFLCIAFSRFFL